MKFIIEALNELYPNYKWTGLTIRQINFILRNNFGAWYFIAKDDNGNLAIYALKE